MLAIFSNGIELVEDSTDTNNSDDDDYQKKKKVALLTKLARRKARPCEEVIDYDSSEVRLFRYENVNKTRLILYSRQ